MRGLITYLQWLDEQWKDWKERTHFSGLTPNGFPPLPTTPSWDVAGFVDAQSRPGQQASHPEETICPTGGS